jgi:hypothetical protein
MSNNIRNHHHSGHSHHGSHGKHNHGKPDRHGKHVKGQNHKGHHHHKKAKSSDTNTDTTTPPPTPSQSATDSGDFHTDIVGKGMNVGETGKKGENKIGGDYNNKDKASIDNFAQPYTAASVGGQELPTTTPMGADGKPQTNANGEPQKVLDIYKDGQDSYNYAKQNFGGTPQVMTVAKKLSDDINTYSANNFNNDPDHSKQNQVFEDMTNLKLAEQQNAKNANPNAPPEPDWTWKLLNWNRPQGT